MTSRTRAPKAGDTERTGPPADPVERLGWAQIPARLRAAFAVAVVGAVLLAASAAADVVTPVPARGFASAPLLIVLAVLPVLAAGWFAWRGQAVTAAAVFVGAAALAPARALLDLQFVVDPLWAIRPERYVLTGGEHPHAASGVWLLLAGHLAVFVAGLLAFGRAGATPGTAYAEAAEPDLARGEDGDRRLLGWALALGVLTGIGLLMAPFTSGDAYLPALEALSGHDPARIGAVLLALIVALATLVAAATQRPEQSRGVAVGVATAVLAVAVPEIAAGLSVARLGPAVGPWLAVLAALALVAVNLRGAGSAAGWLADRWRALTPRSLDRGAGLVGLLAAVLCVAAFGRPLVGLGEHQVGDVVARTLLPAGVLIGVLGIGLVVGRATALLRPAFVVALAAVALPVAGATEIVSSVGQLRNALLSQAIYSRFFDAVIFGEHILLPDLLGTMSTRPGYWLAIAALAIAALAGLLAALAGGNERADVGQTSRAPSWVLLAVLAIAAVLCAGAFGLPIMRGPDYVAAGLWSNFRVGSVGLLIALLAVLVALALAPVSRPVKAAGLLAGAAGVVGVRVLELPLTSGRVTGATAGPGLWLGLAALVVLIAGAVLASRQPAGEA